MQETKIPVTIDPVRAAQKLSTYNGIIPGRQLKRLNGVCAGDCSEVKVSLESGVDIQGIVYLKGKAVTELTLDCQRCMTPFNTEVTVEFCFTPIGDETEIDELPQAYEPIETSEYGEIRLHDLIEDELIIAVPLIPVHNDGQCNQGSQDVSFGKIEEVEEERPNPFAVLEKLKNK
ncbi:23S rRNA accumulation protein YceD [Paraferrimonas sp. SM1919]|uniref:23S rRNA accumulation protein YceD n=1 Tax=Paraferrimonas sp. SM1919 TaxID=2662263 RepID=UPI0013D79059|nr:23S rRNA accumulation protein YceD [Paraferrimonas sp. SM1919]